MSHVGPSLLFVLAWFWAIALIAQPTAPDLLTTQIIAHADSARHLLEANQDDKAFAMIRAGLQNPRWHQSLSGTLHLYYQLGIAERKISRLAESLAALNRANQLAIQLHDTVQLVRMGYALSVVYADQGQLVQAVGQCHRTLAYAKFHPELAYTSLKLLSALYEELGNQPAADAYRNRFINLLSNSKNPLLRINAETARAENWEFKKRYDQAFIHYTKAIEMVRTLNEPDIVGELCMSLSRVNQKLRHWDAALKALNEAKYWESRYRSIPAQTVIYREMASVLAAQGKPKQALQSAERAVALSYKSQRPGALLPALDTLQRIQSLNGQFRAAWLTAKTLRQLTDSLATVSKVEAVAQIETRYKVAAQETTIKGLQKDALIKKLQVKTRQRELNTIKGQQEILFGVLGSLVIGLSVIGFLFTRTHTLQQKTEEQRQLLESQTAELQASNQTKDKLFSVVSHDLRSPITNLQHLFQNLRQTHEQRGLMLPLLTQAEDQISQLSRLTNNLLYWALTQQGLLQDRLVWVDLTALIADCQLLFQDSIERKHLQISITGQAAPVWADENQMLIVIRNLLDNAIKFAPPNSPIEFGLNTTERGTTLVVSNQIAAQAANFAGSNLGLKLIKGLIERQNGSLRINRPDESIWQVHFYLPALSSVS